MPAEPASDRSYRRQAPPRVEDLLQDYIVDHGFQPGARLPTEATFSAELGVSRNAIREALRSLQSLGIVQIRHGYGAYLAEVSLPRLDDGLVFWGRLLRRGGDDHVLRRIAEARSMIECGLVRQVCGKLTREDFAALHECVTEIERASARGERAFDADRRFHEILYRPLDNWIVSGFLWTLWDTTLAMADHQTPGTQHAQASADHRAIVTSLEAEDADAAADTMQAHFRPMITNRYAD